MVVMRLSKSNGGVTDTINNFPEEMLRHIVGFIDLNLIVQTGILSKKWSRIKSREIAHLAHVRELFAGILVGKCSPFDLFQELPSDQRLVVLQVAAAVFLVLCHGFLEGHWL
ncbi:hypothetical protein L6164_001129 [Bauhinia variegata]|uniref:Uncharacterized protein n=1 Tax=Bauhinia variegata TaxID=167791 RepID=A0ACB9Q839_BAUVA|nr:hypothetical protein L6164_001129 [Bauhinia variegata]